MEETIKDKIHRYLREDMSDEEYALFEAEMQINPELGELVENERVFLTTIYQIASGNQEDSKPDELAKTREILQEITQKHRKKRRINQYAYVGMASAAIFGLVYFILWANKPSATELYETYYHPLGDLSTVIGAEILLNNNLVEGAVDLYAQGNYSAYLSSYNNTQSALDSTASTYSLESDVLLLYAGLCYLETNQHPKAVETLQQIPSTSSVYEEAQWYAALGCLKENDVRGAQESLNKIKVGGGAYRDSANSLMKRF